jgi:hypothetical protein
MGAIIWLASYPKSGNTWMRVFLHNLLINPDKPADINTLSKFCLGEDKAEYFNQFDPRPLSTWTPAEIAERRPKVHELLTQAFPDSVFVKTHNFLGESDGWPLVNLEVTAGAIYMVRNPLDVAISYSHHFGISNDEGIDQLANPGTGTPTTDMIARQIYGSWSLNVQSWTQERSPTLHVVRYEDMVGEPFKTFTGVARFLGLDPPRDRLQRAIANSSFKILKAQEDERGFVERSQYARFFRAGQVDQWKGVLSEEQVDRIVAAHREQMERFGYVPKSHR